MNKRKLVDPYCHRQDCKELARYSFDNQTPPIFCEEHRSTCRMHNGRCNVCENPALYGTVEDNLFSFCRKHKTNNMIRISRNVCVACVDSKGYAAYYNYTHLPNPLYCEYHKKLHMIDVVNNSVIIQKCFKCFRRASYVNNEGNYACDADKTQAYTLMDLITCTEINCSNIAEFGSNRFPEWCEKHKKNTIKKIKQRCTECHQETICDFNGLCYQFCVNKPRRKYFEQRTINILTSIFNMKFITNKKLGNLIPDLIFEQSTHYVVLEIDEWQHKNYEKEKTRMIEIANFLNKPTIFIRYNPNKYKTKGNLVQLAQKETVLIEWTQKCLKQKPNDFKILSVYLFYDGCDINPPSLNIVDL